MRLAALCASALVCPGFIAAAQTIGPPQGRRHPQAHWPGRRRDGGLEKSPFGLSERTRESSPATSTQ